MKPTIGRIVTYTDLHRHQRPAIITVVHHDELTIDLTVFFPDRIDFRHDVKQDTDHEPNTWDWTKIV